jgi:hypothetical protein
VRGLRGKSVLGDGHPSNLTPVQVVGLIWSPSASASGAGSGAVPSTPAGIDCRGELSLRT